jgi:uncharacterized protein (DUF1800 family)
MRAAAPTLAFLAFVTLFCFSAEGRPAVRLPWKEAGLTEREAAAHLLNRFAYGPRPGDVDAVVALGLDRWFECQLAADLPDARLAERLRDLPALRLSAAEIARTYPSRGQVYYEASLAGALPEETEGKEAVRAAVLRWAERQGYRRQRELIAQLTAQKLYRAVLSENQLAEVMADFWFNHFNVSMTDNKARSWLLSYERDAIRPHALGRVRGLLEATARHPAMLLYLDNAQSSAAEGAATMEEGEENIGPIGRIRPIRRIGRREKRSQTPGVNENYARELMELHTLGVDGGYSEEDVAEVARAFTGWTIVPPRRKGFARDGGFLFRADRHDAGAKTVLGRRLAAGRGLADGEEVLDLLAAHPATARHLATKLAVRFVSDRPPAALVDRLASVAQRTGGDVRALLRALVAAPEFWSRQAVGAKIKSPFELAASALRATGADLRSPREVVRWVARMGQPLYACQAPTGYPDRAEAWVSTGALVNRMNFGLELASGAVDGVRLDLPALGLTERAAGVLLGSPEFQRR